jgi:acyl-CoA synthetase (AMP-forming)/AMP-acid ligase II
MTIERYIERNATLYPDKTAIVCGGEHCTYSMLQERISRKAAALQEAGCREGQIVCLRALPTVDYLVDYFAYHVAGCVVAPLEKDLPEASFQKIAHELCPHTVPKGSADILYTTGTTGRSKGVIISHDAIIADAENLIDGQGFSHDLAFVVNGPLNHIGSLSKLYPLMMLGATAIIVDGLKDLNRFFDAFQYPASKMATFLVPASIRMLLQFGAAQLAALADKMDFIETGAAAISQADMAALCRLLPNTRLYNTYASTETGIISTYNYNDGKCVAGCLGRPMKHSQIIITDKGLIACKGRTLMTGYVGDNQCSMFNGQCSMFNGQWSMVNGQCSMVNGQCSMFNGQCSMVNTVYTSDMGMLDADGMLHLTGREDDVINVGGFKVAPTEVEDAALAFPDVEDCVCIPVDHIITGKALKLLVVMKDGKSLDRKALALHLKTRLEPYKIPMLYSQVDKVERTFNGKINRKHYLNPAQ